ncbi:uncharacterized protein LOC112575161 isoform X2 [Pomacea canaliculata]|uniref:uncharacterized protein LOC112575161 isoform X2 n=1 Tax=Pomacea canaliculata TaxID=400727 RepID=UPI000D7380A2|nr:uncharacterized protein LOC112575161 isoform X2 [Pomacea canaliculata]
MFAVRMKKGQPLHLSSSPMLYVVWLFLCLLTVRAQDGKVTCSVPPVEEFHDTVLTCHFPDDLSVSNKDFTVYHYRSNDSPEAVLDCWWLRGVVHCSIHPDFVYNNIVSRTLSITVRHVTTNHTGSYACQIANYDPRFLEMCELIIKPGIENTCSITKEESQSKGTLTCYFSEDIGKTQRNFTVVKSHGQSMTGVDEEQSSGLLLIVLIPTLLGVAVVVAVAIVLFLKYRRKCFSSSKKHTESENQQQSTPMLKLAISHKDDLGAEAQGPFESGAWGGRPICHPLTPSLTKTPSLTNEKNTILNALQTIEKDERLHYNKKTSLMKKEKKERKKVTEDFQEYLEKSVKDMYPDITGTFYFVPPVYFNKTHYRKKLVIGEVTWVPDTPTDNDVRHDRAMQHVIHCLRHLAERRQEKMFVLTQLTFDAYLNNVSTEYVTHRLPTADSNISNNIDLLIIHQKHGVLVGVVKTVSDDDVRGQDNEEKAGEMIILQVKEGLQQLDEAVCTMNHLTSDQKSVKVRKFLMLPRLSRSSLNRAVASQPDQFANYPEIEMSLCADDLSASNAPWDISSDHLDKLIEWWHKMMDKTSDDHNLTTKLYLRLISRFCGPATQPSLQTQDDPFVLPKTLAEAVSVTGDLYNRPMLSQDMMDLLREKRLFLVGPSNTCKTWLLTMVGKKWIKSGHELHVFCGSASSSKSLKHAFREELRPASGINDNDTYSPKKVNVEPLNFSNEKEIHKAVKKCIWMKQEKNVYVVADDVDVNSISYRICFKKFCESLKSQCPDVHLWATSSKGQEEVDGWQVKTFTTPLHCPPAVVRECPPLEASYSLPEVTNTQQDNFYPTDGPPVKYFYHKESAISLHDCKDCGKEVAVFLTKHLLSRKDTNVAEHDVLSEPSATNVTKIEADKKFSVLQDKDLLVFFESGIKQEEKFVEGLRESGISVDTVRDEDDQVCHCRRDWQCMCHAC